MTTRKTSQIVYEQIKREGLLSHMILLVYQCLYVLGPLTGAEVDRALKGTHGGRPRLLSYEQK